VICPVCQHDNYEGDDLCENCGADLRASDTPEPATGYHGRLLGTHLDELGAPAPETVAPDVDVDWSGSSPTGMPSSSSPATAPSTGPSRSS
jgi:hypothetical protein